MIDFEAKIVVGIKNSIALISLAATLKGDYKDWNIDPVSVISDDIDQTDLRDWYEWLSDSLPEQIGVYIVRGETAVSEDEMDYRNVTFQFVDVV